jgi:hypothetical protein
MKRKAAKPKKTEGGYSIAGVLAHEPHLDGSKLFPCHKCGRQVWMSPASQRLLAAGGSIASCLECGQAAVAAGEEFGGMAPGAIEEFYAWLQRN